MYEVELSVYVRENRPSGAVVLISKIKEKNTNHKVGVLCLLPAVEKSTR